MHLKNLKVKIRVEPITHIDYKLDMDSDLRNTLIFYFMRKDSHRIPINEEMYYYDDFGNQVVNML